MENITNHLFTLADSSYRDFNSALIPTVKKELVIGVRTPILRSYAKQIYKDTALTTAFLDSLPHKYYEENNLHAFLLHQIKDVNELMYRLEEFLPFIDNWGTCDGLSPKILAKHKDILLPKINTWLKSKHTYTVRYAILCLMRYFLDDDFDKKYLYVVCTIKSDEYYINMMRAWYLATALAKQRECTLEVLNGGRLDTWTHNKTIQKARESFRISNEDKEMLAGLKKR